MHTSCARHWMSDVTEMEWHYDEQMYKSLPNLPIAGSKKRITSKCLWAPVLTLATRVPYLLVLVSTCASL